MFDSKSFGLNAPAFRPPTDPALRPKREREVSGQLQEAPSGGGDNNLLLLRQLRGRWAALLSNENSAQVAQEAATYFKHLAPSDQLSSREIRLLQQMTSGKARPTLNEEGVPLKAEPKSALQHLDQKIRSLSARMSGNSEPTVTRLEVQVFGASQPMKTGTFEGLHSDPKNERESLTQSEIHHQKPEPTHSHEASPVQTLMKEVSTERTGLRGGATVQLAPPEAPKPKVAPKTEETHATEPPPPPPEVKNLAPVRSVTTSTALNEARSKYPEWLQVKLSEESAPAYLTSMATPSKGPKSPEQQPLMGPLRDAPEAPARVELRRTEATREEAVHSTQLAGAPAIAQAPQRMAQVYQSVLSQGMIATPKSPLDAPKSSSEPVRKGKDDGSEGPGEKLAPPPRSGGRGNSQAPIEQARGLQAALSGSVGKREGAEQESTPRPNLAQGWKDEPAPQGQHTLANGRAVTGHIPIHAPMLDAMQEHQLFFADSSIDHQKERQGGGNKGGQQQQQPPPQGGQPAANPNKAEMQSLETYRLARTDNALRQGLKLNPNSVQLAELAVRHAAHNMESLLKKTYRLDSLRELSREEAVNCLGLVLKMGGEFTFAHSARVLELAMDLADEVGVDEQTRGQVELGALLKDTGEMALLLDQAGEEKLEKMSQWLSSQDLRQAGLLHDIGKTKVPNDILYKPGKLTEEEYRLMQMHPIYGEEIIYPIESLRHLCPVIRGHHERWDGKGYPDGLAGETIPLGARIIAVADVFDALASERPYKAGMPIEKVQAILREGRGTHFDPDLVAAFERVLQRRYPELNNPFA
jgi:HD-GYP domain-containing protein (c-di-GMP phosphodiesterase class II)